MIKIILADDHQMFIDGLRAFLKEEEQIQILGIANNGNKVLELFKEHLDVDVIILDIRMPGLDGIEVAKVLRKEYPKTKILIVSMHNKKKFIIELMKLGVAGYVLKDKSKEELVGAIHNVYRGNAHFGLEILNSIAKSEEDVSDKVELTDREEQVLKLIAEGYPSKEIAKKLYVALATVHVHRKNLLRKTEMENSNQLVRYAIRHGYIEP